MARSEQGRGRRVACREGPARSGAKGWEGPEGQDPSAGNEANPISRAARRG